MKGGDQENSHLQQHEVTIYEESIWKHHSQP